MSLDKNSFLLNFGQLQYPQNGLIDLEFVPFLKDLNIHDSHGTIYKSCFRLIYLFINDNLCKYNITTDWLLSTNL